MKKTLVLLSVIIIVFSFSCSNKKNEIENQDKDKTIISGKIENARDKTIIISYNSTSDTLTLNDKGEFTTNIDIKTATHFVLTNGSNNHCRIYLNPKSKLSFSANSSDFHTTIKFTGDDAEINNYLAKQVREIKNAKINTEGFLYSGDFETFKNSLDALSTSLSDNLELFDKETGNKNVDFVKLETERFKIIIGTVMLNYYTPLINTDKPNGSFAAELNTLIESTDFKIEELIQLYEFRPYVQNLIDYKLNCKVKANGLEINTGEQYANLYLEMIDETFTNKVIKEEVYYFFIKDFANYYGVESVLQAYNNYKSFATNKEHQSELASLFGEYAKLAAGQASVDWSFPDINGKMFSLADFKGKYIYIDVWASWCGPCKQEIPHLKKLKEKFKNKNIAIIGISVDEKKSDWENILKTENIEGIQLFAAGWKNPLCQHFKINSIPRFILLDRDGKIINANADRPSGDIEKVLIGLEGI